MPTAAPRRCGKECPLCEAGDRAQAVAAFNIAIVGDDGEADAQVVGCRATPVRCAQGLRQRSQDRPADQGILHRIKTGKRGTTQHNVAPVSRTALEEDYDITPPDQGGAGEARHATSTRPRSLRSPRLKDSDEIAEEMADEYE